MKKTLLVCLLAAFSMTVTFVGMAIGLIEMARYTPAHADELLAHESDTKLPHAESTLTSGTLPATSSSVTGNPAGGSNLNDGTTREEKTDHFDEKQSEMNKQTDSDDAMRNPALAVQQGVDNGNRHQ